MIYFGMVICQSISFSILFMSLCMSPNLYNSRLSMKQDCIQSESEVTQSRLTLCDPWTVVGQAPLSMGFSRQEYWSGLPFPSPRNLPDPGIEPESPELHADSVPSEPPGKHRQQCIYANVTLSTHSTPLPALVSMFVLCLYFCFTNKFIYTIILDSTCMH